MAFDEIENQMLEDDELGEEKEDKAGAKEDDGFDDADPDDDENDEFDDDDFEDEDEDE